MCVVLFSCHIISENSKIWILNLILFDLLTMDHIPLTLLENSLVCTMCADPATLPKPLHGKKSLRDNCHAPSGSQDWGRMPFNRAHHDLVCVQLLFFDPSNTHGDIAQFVEKHDLPFGPRTVLTLTSALVHICYVTILMYHMMGILIC